MYAPRIRVAPAPSKATWFAVRLGVPALALVGMPVVGLVTDNHAVVAGTLLSGGVIVALLGIEVPLLLRMQRRRHQRLADAAPAGTIFAGRAVAFRPGTMRPAALREGVLLIGPAGLTLTSAIEPTERPELHLPWTAITDIDAAPLGGNPRVGCLKVTDYAGGVHNWRVRPFGPLAAALVALRDNAQPWDGPPYPATAHHAPPWGHAVLAPPQQTTSPLLHPTIVAIAVALAAAAALVVSGLFVSRVAHGTAAGATTCGLQTPPAASSPAAIAYIDAVNKQIPARLRLDSTLASEGNVTHRFDLATEASIDTRFLTDLSAIRFPMRARTAAAALETDFTEYITLLQASYAVPGYFAAHADLVAQLDSSRAAHAAQLRADLGLPPSDCVLRRP